jgi:hypothetical protein
MTLQQVNDFEKINAQLQGLHAEISALSKKSQNDALNKFKLKFVNQLLSSTNTLLGDYKPFPDFSVFDEADMPTNSDAAVMLMQYLNCMEKLRADNIRAANYKWFWIIDNKESKMQTTAPEKIKEK